MKLDVQSARWFLVLKRLVLCVLNLSVLAQGLFAQAVSTAQVSGLVHDASGAAIVGAQVQAKQTDQQLVRTATTDAQGPVSYTHLDVYKRQSITASFRSGGSTLTVTTSNSRFP